MALRTRLDQITGPHSVMITRCSFQPCQQETSTADKWLWIEVINTREVSVFCSAECLAQWALAEQLRPAPPRTSAPLL